MNNQDMGTVIRDGGQRGLRYQRRLFHSPEKVWRAITESEHLRHWFPADIVGERRRGAAIELPFWPATIDKHPMKETLLHGEIRVWQPPAVFEWTWDADVLRWELKAIEGGTLLTFTTWLGDPDSNVVNTAAGYHVCLDHLVLLLDHGSAPALMDADVAPVERRYAAIAEALEETPAQPPR
jgi:uncharacterized protein YndB with AHSA1/START domain